MKRNPRTGKLLEIALSREGAASLHAQLVTHFSLHILNGVLKPGDRLPSVRALARRLDIHHNTVSAAYSELAQHKLVEIRHGSGVYVSEADDAGDGVSELDGIIRSFLETARKKGYSLQAIRNSVGKWLSRQPPDHLLIIEPAIDVQQIIVHELSHQMECRITAATINEALAQPSLLTGALIVTTAYHAAEVKRLLPADALLVSINLQTGQPEAVQLKRLPVGAMVGLVSIGPTMLNFAQVVIASLRGEQLMVRPELFSETKRWQALVRTADIVITDSCCFDTVARFAKKSVLQLSLLSPQIIRYLRATLKNSA